MTDLEIRCHCGAFKAIAHDVSGATGNRCVCYCDDCQAFARFLERELEILDRNGGTEIFQMSPARVEITRGTEHLACMRLSPGGTLRWYTACCNTPIGNTLPSPALPFIGLIENCIDFPDGVSEEEVIGPVRARIHGRFATGDRASLDAYPKVPVGLLLRFLRLLAGWRLSGAHRRTPFHKPGSGEPVAEPLVLSLRDRQALNQRA